ncbi:hypothetical protein [Streptomyces sp. NPDC005805]|uniref:hypothetical protein n=1 Tax=Streptomyces sp. NPDC005805 TaxID=3157068 RepID=UPI0033FA71F8
MTHPPSVGAAPAPPPAAVPAPARPPGDPVQGPGPWAEFRRRLRAAATTEPGRLQIIGAVLAALMVVFGAVTAFEVSDRASAAHDVVERSQPLSQDAASVYRSLADANTAASTGFLAGAEEPAAVKKRYEQDIARASRLLVTAATHTDATSESGRQIAYLNEHLPRYTGLIETARANNRLGRPLGGAYLRYANDLMTRDLLPAAQKLHRAESYRLQADYDDARFWPLLSVATGVLALSVLGWAQRRNYRRTNRVFNHGLLAATVAGALVLLWMTGAQALASARLNDAEVHAQRSLNVLNEARINALQARANENLTLVARGAVLTDDGKDDKYAAEYGQTMGWLDDSLELALRHADDDEGRRPVEQAIRAVGDWQERHAEVTRADQGGDYEGALRKVIGAEGSTTESFDAVDAALAQALEHEQREFTEAAKGGRAALTGLAAGAALLAVLGAVAAILGINRRLSEYR